MHQASKGPLGGSLGGPFDEPFQAVRPRLMAIGYRMLASVDEAEDLVQDVWLRWHEQTLKTEAEIVNSEAWLVAVATRMAIDRLRAAKIRRQAYPGMWFPQPWLVEEPTTPEQARELADDVSIAFLVLLDCLTPEARAAFLLREVFEVDYPRVAAAIGKSETLTRQIVHRAKQRLLKAGATIDNPPSPSRPAEQLELLQRLVEAISNGRLSEIHALLAQEAELSGDFGNVVPNLAKPLLGSRRIAQLYLANHLRHGPLQRLELVRLNGEWALVRHFGNELDSVQTFEFKAGLISRVRIQRNPEKLLRLKQQGLR